jgi:hypothetical protein
MRMRLLVNISSLGGVARYRPESFGTARASNADAAEASKT